MRISLLVCLMLCFSYSYSQKTVNVDIVLTKGDTIKNAKMIIKTNFFNNTNINELSFVRKVVLQSNYGKYKIKEVDIRSLEFQDHTVGKRVFVNNRDILGSGYIGCLIEEIVKGELGWYKFYTANSYDGSVQTTDYFVLKNKEHVSVGGMGSWKKNLKKITQKFPELIADIEAFKKEEDAYTIIEKYNKLCVSEK